MSEALPTGHVPIESATQPHDTDIQAGEAFRQQMLERMRSSPLR
jgi:hypothetical protein